MRKMFFLVIVIIVPLLANAQIKRKSAAYYNNRSNYEKDLRDKAEKAAFKKASSEEIFSYDVLKSYLDDKNLSVDDLKKSDPELGKLFKQVVSKGKEFPYEYKNKWRQDYYEYLLNKNYDDLDKKARLNDSIDRNRWFESDIYLGLKLYCMQAIPPMDKECSELIERFGVDKLKAYNHFVNYSRPVKPIDIIGKTGLGKKEYTDDDLANLRDIDIIGLHCFLIERLSEKTNLKEIYSAVLGEMGYGTVKRLIPDYDDSAQPVYHSGPSKSEFVFSQEKNNPKVKELDSLYHQWKEIVKSRKWDYYKLSKRAPFRKACSDIKEALEYRENNPLKDGIYKIGDVEVPCKVVDDKLVVDGVCTLTLVENQYPNATGDWYKKRTSDLKLVVKVVNGVAVSKTFSGTQKVWMPDENVYKKTKGGTLEKTAKTLEAKPVVVKTINVADVAHYLDFKLVQDRMLDRLVFSQDPDASLSHLCKCYLEGTSEKGDDEWYLKKIKLPIQPVDISQVIE